jgi:tetratricopeptide (TPR) repeat protein
MRAVTLISAISILLLLDCMAAEEYIEMQDYQTGITSKVLKSASDWFDKGSQLYMNGSYELAIKCYDKAIELDPSYDGPWINKGFCLEHLGRYNEALEAFDNATRLNPLMPYWNEKGNILLRQGKYDEALKSYNISIQLNPKDKEAWSQKGYALGLLGKYNESILAFDKIIELSSSDKHGWINEGSGKFNKSTRTFEFVKINPQLANAWHNKGLSLKALHRDTEAEVAFTKAKELGYTG